MKTAILAAGAMMLASFTATPDASASDIGFSLTLGGPSGVLQIGSPGRASSHSAKGYGYGGYYPYGYGGGYNAPYYGGSKGHGYGYGNGYGYGKRGWGGYYEAPRRRNRHRCMSSREIRWMLRSHGWNGFHLAKLTSGIAVVYSYRDGMRFRIKIDRCNRAIIRVSPKGGFY